MEHRDYVSATGVVDSWVWVDSSLTPDYDWCLKVRPSEKDRHLLTSPYGYTNTNGLIECEVHPNEDLFRTPGPGWWANNYFSGLRGRTVTVTGTWVTYSSHSFAGEDLPSPGTFDMGKAEVHAITSVLVEIPNIHGPDYIKNYRFMVFCETPKGNLQTANRH